MKFSILILLVVLTDIVQLASARVQVGVLADPSLLKFGYVSKNDDAEILKIHQHNMKRAIAYNNNVTLSMAIADYFAAVVGMTNMEVIGEVARYMRIGSNLTCSHWDFDFTESVNYMLCDCLTNASWISSIRQFQWKEEYSLTDDQSKYLLFTHATKRIHMCNRQFAWSLLTMLTIERGTETALKYFKRDLYDEAVEVMEINHEYPGLLALELIYVLEKHLYKEKTAEQQYENMDLIVDTLNDLYNFGDASWMDRFNLSMANQRKLRIPKPIVITTTADRAYIFVKIVLVAICFIMAGYGLHKMYHGHLKIMEVIPSVLPI